jgi:hypothetical protein
MAEKLNERLVEVNSIIKTETKKLVWISGFDKNHVKYNLLHNYETGEIIQDQHDHPEKLEKIYNCKKTESFVSIVGENSVGDFYHIIHNYENGIIFNERMLI